MAFRRMHLLIPEALLLMLFGGMLLCLVEAEVHYYDFALKNKNYTRVCQTKSMLVVNDQFPGPTIHVRKGDTVFVNVYNYGDIKVTIHWHGVKQPRNSWSDGAEYVTQCAIKPGGNFTYEVIFSDEEGTLWWHAHSDWTRNTVHGAIVIHPPQGATFPFPEPDGEEIIILGSWYNYDVNLALEDRLATGRALPVSDAYLINGQPGDLLNCSKEGTYRWLVEPGKTYLLRLINAAMNAQLFFSIAGHNLTLVSQDASYLKPFVTSYIMIGPGQTMDVLVTTNQSPAQYYMAARQYYTQTRSRYTASDKTNVTAILQYTGDHHPPQHDPYFPDATLPSYVDYRAGISFRNKLRSLTAVDVPKNITTKMYIAAALNQLVFNSSGDERVTVGSSLNNVTFVNPWVDVLQAYYYNISGFYTEDFPDNPPVFYDFVSDYLPANTTQSLLGTKVRVLEYGEEVEIIFQSSNMMNGTEDHPMHLHGHSFYMVGNGYGNFDFDEDPKTYNLVDPPYINTASLPTKGWAAIRFRALNPGVWLWHCHLEKHYTWGMNTVLIVKNGPTPDTSLRAPPSYMPTCEPPVDIQ